MVAVIFQPIRRWSLGNAQFESARWSQQRTLPEAFHCYVASDSRSRTALEVQSCCESFLHLILILSHRQAATCEDAQEYACYGLQGRVQIIMHRAI